jgi:uncharacterized hydrophobic protein (TIGR00271 family)
VLCDVAREAANDAIEWLQDHGIHHDGAIAIDEVATTVSDAAEDAESRAPGHGADALVWEQLESIARNESRLTASFLTFMGIAALIAAIGILLDSPILIIGAMVVGPEYGPLASLCVGIVRRRRHAFATAASTLAVGLALAAATALVGTALFRAVGIAPDAYDISDHELTAFISRPDALAAVVAVLAGVVGMLALTESRGGTLIGVLVSVTTIPAAGNVGAAAAYGAWREVGGAAAQLAINLAGLILAGVATLSVQARLTTGRLITSFPRRTRPLR